MVCHFYKGLWLPVLVIVASTLAMGPVLADVDNSGWLDITAEPISHEDARVYYQAKQAEIDNDRSQSGLDQAEIPAIAPAAATTQTAEIVELARALQNDPRLIYDYVHNHIEYEPYFASLKGAVLTLLEASGNDFDQASLMIALLRASGYTAQYVFGTITVPGAQMTNWIGVNDPLAVSQVLANGGVPIVSWSGDGTATFEHVWVRATIGGTNYVFDPSFKQHTVIPGIDLVQAMGYNKNGFLNAALSGATVTSSYTQNISQQNLSNILTQYSNSLVNTIRSQHPNATVEEIIGGRKIVQSELSSYQTSLPFATSTTAIWNEIPQAYVHTLRIQHQGIDYSMNLHDLAGKRLTLTYTGSRQPQIRLDGAVVATGNVTTTGQYYDFVVTVDHAYATDVFDQTGTYIVKSGSTYAVFYNFGGDSAPVLSARSKKLNQSMAAGSPPTSEAVLGETLHIMGVTWANEARFTRDVLASAVADVISTTHHRVGVVGQETGYLIDVKNNLSTTTSRNQVDTDQLAQFLSTSVFMSGFEHGVLEQLMGSTKPAASTVKLLHLANAAGLRIYQVTSSNFGSVPLSGYSSSMLSSLQSAVSSGWTAYVPQSGSIAINAWRGGTFMAKLIGQTSGNGVWFRIEGGYNGGASGNEEAVDPSIVSHNTTESLFDPGLSLSVSTPVSCDPVDMATGDFLYDHDDIALSGPMGLGFSRSYASSLNYVDRGLGFGWRHNYDIYLERSSNYAPAMGKTQPTDAAALITALYVAFDLMKNEDSLRGWVLTSLISKWAMDQLLDNAVTVNIGSENLQYIRLADGTYEPPPGITTQLIDNGNGTFSLLERFGTRYDFNNSDKISKITDIDGNTTNFTYNGANLGTVSNSFNQTLTLAYSGSKLQSVTDSTGRSIGFTYEGDGDLDTYTDPENKVWDYGYDTEHRLRTIHDPTTTLTVTNNYDSLGRVVSQLMPLQNGGTARHDCYFSGFRNVEEDPNNNQMVYFLDRKGRTVGVQDALDNINRTEFDGQNQVVKTIDARTNETSFTYDADHNLRFITDALTHQTEHIYDTWHRLTDTIDPLLHSTQFGYDSKHHLTLTRDALLNDFTATYYANGTQHTDTDGRGTVTRYTYDSRGNPDTSKVSVHPLIDYTYNARGELQSLTDQDGATTSFLYDDRGLVTEITDPLNRKTTFTYDAAGRLDTITDRNLSLTDFAYTPTGKVETIDYASDPTVSFTYDIRDNLDTMTDGLGLTDYSYDPVRRLSSQTDPHGFTVGYAYDEVGNLTTLTYPGNKTVTYTYDALNRLKTVTIDWLANTPTATYHYDEAGRLDRIDQFNGTVTDYTFDAANRLTGLVNKKANGDILSSHQFPILDGNGNRLREVREEPIAPTLPTQKVAFTYNTPRNRLTSTTNDTFSYDNEGQQTHKSGTSYTFDDAHRLTHIGSNTEFFYDGANNRLKITRDGTTTKYIYDANNNLLAEANNSNQIQRYYIHGASLLGLVEGNNLYTYHYDATGHTLALTNASETIINAYSYTPYGRIANESETIPQPFKYVGQYGVQYEAAHAIYYMRARYYDPDTGRFISEDPIGFEGGQVNLYAYVSGNPISAVDPNGLRFGLAIIGTPLEGVIVAPRYTRNDLANFSANLADQANFAAGMSLVVGRPEAALGFGLLGAMANGASNLIRPNVEELAESLLIGIGMDYLLLPPALSTPLSPIVDLYVDSVQEKTRHLNNGCGK